MRTIAELRALEAKATPSPWTPSVDEPGDVVLWGPTEDWLANIGNWARQHPEIDAKSAARQFCELRDAADAELTSAMRANFTALLDVVEFLKNNPQQHFESDDPWMSCPKAENSKSSGTACHCGADEYNAAAAELIAKLETL